MWTSHLNGCDFRRAVGSPPSPSSASLEMPVAWVSVNPASRKDEGSTQERAIPKLARGASPTRRWGLAGTTERRGAVSRLPCRTLG